MVGFSNGLEKNAFVEKGMRGKKGDGETCVPLEIYHVNINIMIETTGDYHCNLAFC